MRTSFQQLDHILPTEYQRNDIVLDVYKESSLKVEHDPKGAKGYEEGLHQPARLLKIGRAFREIIATTLNVSIFLWTGCPKQKCRAWSL